MIPEPELAVAEAGYSLWRYFRPWLHLRIALRGARNRRRARLGFRFFHHSTQRFLLWTRRN
jgi:hypothetical protein